MQRNTDPVYVLHSYLVAWGQGMQSDFFLSKKKKHKDKSKDFFFKSQNTPTPTPHTQIITFFPFAF